MSGRTDGSGADPRMAAERDSVSATADGKPTNLLRDGALAEPTSAALAGYERLAELAEAELAACEAERPEDLTDLYAEAETIRASLPARPPTEAEPALRRAAAAQERIGLLLGARLAERDGDLQRVHRAREAAHAYATTANARASA